MPTAVTIRAVATREQWEACLTTLAPNTFLHTWEWGHLQQQTGEAVQYLGFWQGEQLRGLALIILVRAKRGFFYLVPHGPLAPPELIQEFLTQLVSYLRQQAGRDRAVALRVAPLLETTPSHTTLFRELGFRPAPLHIHSELTWMLDIAPAPEVLLAGMRKTTRHAIRAAERAGVTATVITDPAEAAARFLPLYDTTRQRHGFVPFSADFINKQLAIFTEQDHAYAVVAQHGGHDVAAAIIIQSGTTAFYYHGASVPTPKVPAAHAVQWAAILEAKRRGCTQYNFWGIAPAGNPKHPFAGITVFKQGFGGYAKDYLHAQDLPLSPRYWILWAVDEYRRWRRGF